MSNEREAELKAARTAELHKIMPPMAGFEVAQIMCAWANRWRDKAMGIEALGPPAPRKDETDQQFGERIALGIRKLSREI